jgi:hypothetical protein
MELVIEASDLPGLTFRNAGVPVYAVHVGVQVRKEPTDLVPADAPSARWQLDVRVSSTDQGWDFHGPAVHGRRGERFVYLTWGNVGSLGGFEMFRRLKLMLDLIDPTLVAAAIETERPLRLQLGLTDRCGGPLCGRLDPATARWSV